MSTEIASGIIEKLKAENKSMRLEVKVTRQNFDALQSESAALREQLEYAIKAGAKREAELLVMLGKEAQP